MSSMNFTCDSCGREVFGCTFVNGMKFCAKCYQETFGETDKDRKISDLEAKLAESEKKAYSRGHSQRDIANEIKLNALREDVANKEKRIVELKKQLAENNKQIKTYAHEIAFLDKKIANIKNSCDYYMKRANDLVLKQNQKAIEQLEQIINLFEPYENEEKDTILCANNGISFLEYIDNQIKQLKELK